MAAPAASYRMPPGPRLPRWAQTLLFVFASRRFISAAYRRHGDLVSFSTHFDNRFVMVFGPDAIKQVFTGPPDVLHAGEANAVLGPVLGDRSVLLLDGVEHLHHRRLMLPPFHGARMQAYERVMREAADRAIDRWPVGRPFQLLPEMQALTLEVIMRAVFGIEDGASADELETAIRGMIEPFSNRAGLLVAMLSAGRFGDRGAMKRFEDRRRRVDELIYAEIARRREAADLAEREDILSLLLEARDEEGEPLTDRELRDQLVTLLVAGHETTATGLAWTFELLLRAPAVERRLRESLAAGGDDYLDAVVKESLRMRPVVPGVGRKLQAPFEVGGYLLPAGTELNPSIALMHRRSDLYPEPDTFRPERFLDPDTAPDTYTWIPFGGGIRRCLGASFATFEMGVVVRRVLERARLAAADPRPERVYQRGITLVPKHGARVVQPQAPAAASHSSAQADETLSRA
ncbi:MAG TPA: cytochrome P450 [Solirubrobacteraceae bacterium]|nr:cytochrome P450 [Solirubrobacteraceae bacterium]